MTRWLVLLLLAASAEARAQPIAMRPTSEEATAHLYRGEALSDAGKHNQALEEFDRGYRIEGHPVFLYAKGGTYRRMGDCTNAVASFQAFLATRPPEDLAKAARDIIELCPIAPSESSPPPPAESHRAAWYRDPAGGVLAATGTLGLAIGTTYLVLGERTVRAANNATPLIQLEELGARAKRERTIGAVGLAAGGALVAGAVIRYVLVGRTERSKSASRSTSTVSLSPLPGAIAISWAGAF